MTILVCPLSRLDELIGSSRPGRVISLMDPHGPFPELGSRYAGRHLRLGFHDITIPVEDCVLPAAEHVGELLEFLATWDRRDGLLIHCRAGISRSPAAAFVAACFANPDAPEREIALALRRASPVARPNQTLVRLADAEMERDGRMSEAIASTGRELPWMELDEADPFRLPSTFGSA